MGASADGIPELREASLAWPSEGSVEVQIEWVKKYLSSELADLKVESISSVGSGFMSAAFFVNMVDGSRFVFIRSFAPKHRAWACQRQICAEQGDIVCQLKHCKYSADTFRSVELVPACDGGEVQSYPVFMGFPGDVPTPALCEKVGEAMAKFHSVGTSWHSEFASKAAYSSAGHPDVPPEVAMVPHRIYDEPGVHSMVQYQLKLLSMVLPEELQSVESDASFLEAEVRMWEDHPVLPVKGGSSLLARQVTGHGDLHGENVLTHKGEPVFIDWESAYSGPAGWDVAHFYQCLRRYQPEHDYQQVSAFARGYLRGAGGAEPTSEAIEDFLFDTICWWYFANMKQAACLFLVTRLCGLPPPPEAPHAFAKKTLGVAYLRRFLARITELRGGDEHARRDFARKGNLDL